MIRLILKTTFQDAHNGCAGEEFETICLESPELEAVLRRGGRSEVAHLRTQLIGCELVESQKPQNNPSPISLEDQSNN